MTRIRILPVMFFGILGCALLSVDRPYASETQEKLNFHEDFEQSRLDARWDSFFIAPPDDKQQAKQLGRKIKQGEVSLNTVALQSPSLALVSVPARSGKQALKITVRPQDARAINDEEKGKSRAEIGVKDAGVEGKEVWYSWSVFIPKDYTDAPEGKNDFQVLAQFSRFVKKVGDHYADYSTLTKDEKKNAEGASSALSIRYHREKGQSYFLLYYGVKGARQEQRVPMEKGRWYDWLLDVKWSTKDDGFVKARVNGQEMAYAGANMYTSSPIEARWGIYRGHYKFKTVNSIFVDDIYITEDPNKIQF